jgi:uncharacterized membrane protein
MKAPWLASDIKRGYLIIAIAVPITLLVPFAIVLAGVEATRESLTIATLFISWCLIGTLATVLTFVAFGRASSDELRQQLVATTPRDRRARIVYYLNGGGAAAWAITGSVLAVTAVTILSLQRTSTTEPVIVYGGIGVVVASLFMTISAYAVRYAREYASNGGFDFAGEKPRFGDFFYLAVQVATTFSTSDVQVTTTKARRLVTANSLISFAFNTVTVALLVSVLVSSAAG